MGCVHSLARQDRGTFGDQDQDRGPRPGRTTGAIRWDDLGPWWTAWTEPEGHAGWWTGTEDLTRFSRKRCHFRRTAGPKPPPGYLIANCHRYADQELDDYAREPDGWTTPTGPSFYTGTLDLQQFSMDRCQFRRMDQDGHVSGDPPGLAAYGVSPAPPVRGKRARAKEWIRGLKRRILRKVLA
ncbi:hypothetical protein S40285_10062 [Stachybotrys chlorohalonatus IBT 40285]|uniref:Uncharacterized protein n=1 Tax=Stachybotrys chlorohalonatus (strain IBT 40285) TaxID=1283841 RepID=A0A084QMC9_STAC4|nr:hypothetical protein S40285_10062 [Stachybotrys chlorohalonata IBT 40285]